ncbi:MAG: U32 family peptidase, partial [Cyanobacteria bacterium J06641_5]
MTRAPQKPDLLAPAGNWDCAKAAVENGADALYFGLDRFNARMRADNFTEADLPELMAFLHGRGVRGYVTFNTLVFPAELPAAEAYLRKIIAAGVDAAIVQDVGICRLIRHLSSDFPIHASTQMTVTSAAGVAFARNLGCQLVVLARECSLKEIEKIRTQSQASNLSLPLEVFVHGALCVSYSGQCLTSEALGGRSANRGECAQACRMTYDLIADGRMVDLGDRQYLLSPQDLAGIDVLPELVRSGVSCLKVEGRLKTPEYVANVTRTYRQAIDRAFDDATARPTAQEHYDLEMGFSRGLHTGWFQGIDNQALVHARFAKKRGVYLGQVEKVKGDRVFVTLEGTLKPGDGIVFVGRKECGGRVYGMEAKGDRAVLTFGKGSLDLRQIRPGDELWKTSDPELDRRLRKTFSQETPQYQREITLEVAGSIGEALAIAARDEFGYQARVQSEMPLEAARNRPLTGEQLRDKLGRLGNTPFVLGELTNNITGDVILPVSELNRLRREFVSKLERLRGDRGMGLGQAQPWQLRDLVSYQDLLPTPEKALTQTASDLIVLVRSREQLEAALQADLQTIYCELEDPRTYREMVAIARTSNAEIWVAPPRITKPSENYILAQVRRAEADGYLVRNYDHLKYFKDDRCRGDFSLNFANSITANYFRQKFELETL